MDNFVVSARKYRPSTFATVIGQSGITTTLKNAIHNKHLAQAFLFCGPRGVGKTTCARILAKTINCTNLTAEGESCNACDSCISFNNGQSLNIFELDGASNSTVEDMRGLVEQVRYPPHSGQYKIYIIDEVHMLSASAFNAFLKTLEEPPPYAIFILATTEKHKIIPTILSRCQIFDFNRITVDDIAHHLLWIAGKEGVTAEAEALHLIAQKADGALRDALSIFDQIVSFAGNNVTYNHVIENLNLLDYDYYFRVTDLMLEGNYTEMLLLLDEVISEGFELNHFILGLGNHFRDLLVSREPKTVALLEVGPSTKDRYLSQSKQCSPSQLYQWLQIANRCDYEFKSVQNQRLHLEFALLRMCTVSEANPFPVATNVVQTEKKSPDSNAPNSIAKAPVTEKKIAPPVAATPPVTTPPETKPEATPAPLPKKPAAPEAPATALNHRSGTISISQKLSSMREKKPAAEKAAVAVIEHPFIPIQTEALLAPLKIFTDNLRSQGRMQLALALTHKAISVSDKNVIHIPVINAIQAAEVNEAKADLVPFLKNVLKNHHIDILPEVIETDSNTETAYTPMEKFRKMAEKNPDLNQLRQHFDLELDF